MEISWQDNSINYLDFLRALEKSSPSRPQSADKEDSSPVNFAALSPELIVRSIQEVVGSAQPALLQVGGLHVPCRGNWAPPADAPPTGPAHLAPSPGVRSSGWGGSSEAVLRPFSLLRDSAPGCNQRGQRSVSS